MYTPDEDAAWTSFQLGDPVIVDLCFNLKLDNNSSSKLNIDTWLLCVGLKLTAHLRFSAEVKNLGAILPHTSS